MARRSRRWTVQPPVGTPIDRTHPQALGLEAFYPLNEPGGTLAADLSGYRRNGTVVAGTSRDVSARGRAPDFDGVTEWVTSVDMLGGITRFSLSAWMRRTATGDWCGISRGTANSTRMLMSFWTDGNIYCNMTGSFDGVASNDTLWHHCVLSYNASRSVTTRLILYLDGIDQGLSATWPTVTTDIAEPWYIGRTYHSGYKATDGGIVDVRFYSRDLTIADVWDLYVNPYDIYQPRRVSVSVSAAAPSALTIDVSDPVTVDDVDTVTATTVLITASVSDAATVADVDTVAVHLGISEEDAATVADVGTVVTTDVLYTIDESDAVTVTDVDTVATAGAGEITASVSDPVTVDDVDTVALEPLIASVAETVTVTDVDTVATAGAAPLTISAVDTVTAADVDTVTQTTVLITVSEAEAVTATDVDTVVVVLVGTNISEVETLTTDDVVTVYLTPLVASVADAVTVTDTPSVISPVAIVNVADVVTVADEDTVATELGASRFGVLGRPRRVTELARGVLA